MSSKTTLQTNNNVIDGYNDRLENIINTINSLPNVSDISEDLSTELSTQTGLLNTQDTSLDDIEAALEGKAAGGGGGGVTFVGGAINHTENMGYLYVNTGFIDESAAYRVIISYWDYTTSAETDRKTYIMRLSYLKDMSEAFGMDFYDFSSDDGLVIGMAAKNASGGNIYPEIGCNVDMIQVQPPATTSSGIADYIFVEKL